MRLRRTMACIPPRSRSGRSRQWRKCRRCLLGKTERGKKDEALIATLYQQIGQLKVEVDWLQKKVDGSLEEKRREIGPDHRQVSIERQCELLGLPRSSYYYVPLPESEENLRLMRLLDEQ